MCRIRIYERSPGNPLLPAKQWSTAIMPDEKGDFSIANIPPGKYRMVLSQGRTLDGTAVDFEIAEGQPLKPLGISPPGSTCRVTGKIKDYFPLPATGTKYCLAALGPMYARAEVQSDGSFTFRALAPGKYKFILLNPDILCKNAGKAVVSVEITIPAEKDFFIAIPQ